MTLIVILSIVIITCDHDSMCIPKTPLDILKCFGQSLAVKLSVLHCLTERPDAVPFFKSYIQENMLNPL